MTSIKKKKGFTLIELLAVLVILAILALITVPMVLKTIGNSKKSAAESSMKLYSRAAQQGVLSWATDNGKSTFEIVNSWEQFQSTYGDYIEYSGKTIRCLNASVNGDGDVTLLGCGIVEEDKEFVDQDLYSISNNNKISSLKVKSTNESQPAILYGDVDGDGKVTIADAEKIRNYITVHSGLDENQMIAADANQDGEITVRDIFYIERNLIGNTNPSCPFDTEEYMYELSDNQCIKYLIVK